MLSNCVNDVRDPDQKSAVPGSSGCEVERQVPLRMMTEKQILDGCTVYRKDPVVLQTLSVSVIQRLQRLLGRRKSGDIRARHCNFL
jgi:hypothetical protein